MDLLFCNLDEARALTGKHDPIDCAQEIHKHAENVALTLGGDGFDPDARRSGDPD